MSSVDYVLAESQKRQTKEKEEKLLEKIQSSKKTVLENSCKKIDFKAPIISREGNGVIYPNTINTIQGQSGVHKSRLVEIFIALLLSKLNKPRFLGFESIISREYFATYADTERNLKEQFPYALQQIKRMADIPIEKLDIKLDPFSFIDISREDRFTALKLYLDDIRKKVDDHLFIVLDVVTDCIGNFNDPKESMGLIDLMNAYINSYDVTFLCVIHENPGGTEKARGHLGTELINKSSTVFQIGFDTKGSNLIKITYKKCRNSKRFEPIYLVFSEETKGLVLADQSQIEKAKNSKAQKAKIEEVQRVLGEALKEPASKTDLLQSLGDYFKCGKRTLEHRLKTIYENQLPILNDKGQKLVLDKYSERRLVFYALIPTEK